MSEITGPPPAYKVPQTSGKGPDHAQHTDQKQKKNASAQQDNASSKDQSGTQSKHHTAEPAVTVSASMMGLKVGDHVEGRVEKVTPDNQLVFITKEAIFLVEPSAGMKPGQSLELEVTSTNNPMKADIVRREAQRLDPPIPVEMSLVQVSKEATENALRQLPQASSQQMPHYPTISPIPKAIETGQDSLILRQQPQNLALNTANKVTPSSPQAATPSMKGSQSAPPDTQPSSTFQPNLTGKRQAPLPLLDIQDKSLLNKLPIQPMQPNLSLATKSLMAHSSSIDGIKPLMVFQATVQEGSINKNQISFQHPSNAVANKQLNNFQVALFSSDLKNMPNTVTPLEAKITLTPNTAGAATSPTAVLTLANATLSIPKEQSISLTNMIGALTTKDSAPNFLAVLMPPATTALQNTNVPRPSNTAQLYEQLKSEQSGQTPQGPARGTKASQSAQQQANVVTSAENSNDADNAQNGSTANTIATPTPPSPTTTTTTTATEKTAATGAIATSAAIDTSAASDKAATTGAASTTTATTDKSAATGTMATSASSDMSMASDKAATTGVAPTTPTSTDKSASTGTIAASAASGTSASSDKAAASDQTAVTAATSDVTTAQNPSSAKTASSNQPNVPQENPSILAQSTVQDNKAPLPELSQIVETKDDALKLAESMRPENPAPSIPMTREIPHVALKDALQTWPVMAASAQALQSTLSPALQGQTASRLPNMGQALQNSALFFLAAVGLNDPKTWLGKKVVSDLEQKNHGTLLKALQKEFSRLFQLSGLGEKTATGGQLDWRPHLIPLFQNDQAQAMVVLTRPDDHQAGDQEKGQDQGGDADHKNRFVVATRFKTFGMIELDGLLRTNRLDLHLRSTPILAQPIQDLLSQTIEAALNKNDLAGQIKFGDLKDSSLNIPEILDKAENTINEHQNLTIG